MTNIYPCSYPAYLENYSAWSETSFDIIVLIHPYKLRKVLIFIKCILGNCLDTSLKIHYSKKGKEGLASKSG